ncbi:hypothetical protein FD724_14115 [Nostoc sp. C057]|uniref:hypothetical protein n=1 Tax=Nostoc sp. C057 TaxID=2576903 RepID=UPI0015C3F0D6|nr:hypothetical protein FD724_14115 [Nostoc sp. C057]
MGEEKGGYIEGCPRDWEELPRPDLPLVLGMDGGYVRSYDKKSLSKAIPLPIYEGSTPVETL